MGLLRLQEAPKKDKYNLFVILNWAVFLFMGCQQQGFEVNQTPTSPTSASTSRDQVFNSKIRILSALQVLGVTSVDFQKEGVLNRCDVNVDLSCHRPSVDPSKYLDANLWEEKPRRIREMLLHSSDVQGSLAGCRQFASLLKTECQISTPVTALWYDQSGDLVATHILTKYNYSLGDWGKQKGAFQFYFNHCGEGQHIEDSNSQSTCVNDGFHLEGTGKEVSNYKLGCELPKPESYSQTTINGSNGSGGPNRVTADTTHFYVSTYTVKPVNQYSFATQGANIWDYSKKKYDTSRCIPIECAKGYKLMRDPAGQIGCWMELKFNSRNTYGYSGSQKWNPNRAGGAGWEPSVPVECKSNYCEQQRQGTHQLETWTFDCPNGADCSCQTDGVPPAPVNSFANCTSSGAKLYITVEDCPKCDFGYWKKGAESPPPIYLLKLPDIKNWHRNYQQQVPAEFMPGFNKVSFKGVTPCNAKEGYYCAASKGGQDICPAGWFCEGGNVGRQLCPQGQYSFEGFKKCQPCKKPELVESAIFDKGNTSPECGLVRITKCVDKAEFTDASQRTCQKIGANAPKTVVKMSDCKDGQYLALASGKTPAQCKNCSNKPPGTKNKTYLDFIYDRPGTSSTCKFKSISCGPGFIPSADGQSCLDAGCTASQGWYCKPKAKKPTECPKDSKCEGGVAQPIPCGDGAYAPKGSTTCTLCSLPSNALSAAAWNKPTTKVQCSIKQIKECAAGYSGKGTTSCQSCKTEVVDVNADPSKVRYLSNTETNECVIDYSLKPCKVGYDFNNYNCQKLCVPESGKCCNSRFGVPSACSNGAAGTGTGVGVTSNSGSGPATGAGAGATQGSVAGGGSATSSSSVTSQSVICPASCGLPANAVSIKCQAPTTASPGLCTVTEIICDTARGYRLKDGACVNMCNAPGGMYCAPGTVVPYLKCPAGSFCKGTSFQPEPCPAGSKCKASASTPVECPPGQWSLAGSVSCQTCAAKYKPANSTKATFAGGNTTEVCKVATLTACKKGFTVNGLQCVK